MEIDDTAGAIYYNRGRANLHLGNNDAAIDDFENAVYFVENHFDSHIFLVSLLFDQNRFEEAMAAADNMIIYFPNRPEPYVWRAVIYIEQNDREAAFEDLFLAIDLDDAYPFSYVHLGGIYARMNKPIDAVNAYCTYVALNGQAEDYIMEYIEENGDCDS